MKKQKILLGLVFFICFFLIASVTQAFEKEMTKSDAEGTFTVMPSKIEGELKPGERRIEKIKVINRFGKKMNFVVETEDITRSSGTESSAANWVTPEVNNFELEQGEMISMNVTIDVPTNIDAGGHYAGVYIRAIDPNGVVNSKTGTSVQIQSRIGIPILAVTGEEVEEKGKFKLKSEKGFYNHGPVNLTAYFENTGTVHQRPEGKIVITNMFGKKITEFDIDGLRVLPGEKSERMEQWPKKWLWGIKYTATAEVTYGQNRDIKDTAMVQFYAFPIVEVIILALVIFAIVFTVMMLMNKKKPKTKGKKKK